MDLLGCQNKRCQKKFKNDQSEQFESNINDTSSTSINTLQVWSTLAKNRVEL